MEACLFTFYFASNRQNWTAERLNSLELMIHNLRARIIQLRQASAAPIAAPRQAAEAADEAGSIGVSAGFGQAEGLWSLAKGSSGRDRLEMVQGDAAAIGKYQRQPGNELRKLL